MEIGAFCREENPRLVGMLSLYCGDIYVAEDLAQEALARAWHGWGKVSKLDDPAAWTRRVAINLANSRFRRLAAERRAKTKLETVEHGHVQGDVADAEAIRNVVSRLPRQQRAAVVLRYYMDMPYAEVAEIMQIPESTARSLVHRGIAKLRLAEGFPTTKEVTDVP